MWLLLEVKRLVAWRIYFDTGESQFTYKRAGTWGDKRKGISKLISFSGDENAVLEAKSLLADKLKNSGRIKNESFNMEPFEVLRDVIRSAKYSSVGGPIQMVKIYEHSNVVPFSIFWPDKESGKVSLLGRPLMKYEKSAWRTIDPDDPEFVPRTKSKMTNK